MPDTELHAAFAAGLHEPLRRSGAVGADGHLSPVGVHRDLSEGVVCDRDVIRCGVGCGVAGVSHTGERLAGGVEVRHQRMEPETALVGARRSLFVGMGVHQRGIDVDHIEPRVRTRGSTPRPSLGPGRP